MGAVLNLQCARCGNILEAKRLQNLCSCGGPLLANYDLQTVKREWRRESLGSCHSSSMWRYGPVLPCDIQDAVTLGEGWTPLIAANRLSAAIGGQNVLVKDEGRNPTHSFKARGLSCAVSMAKNLGARKLAIPSAGNAAGALALYAAKAGLESHIFMPSDVPQSNFIESVASGAHVTLIDGIISDCGRLVAERSKQAGWFEVSTLKEPYRVEGKKTMGYEVAEQMGWTLPDAILYPCGGGVGLIGMWKAFAELESLGWIGPKRPKMIAVQAEGCAPIVRAFENGQQESEFWKDPFTVASGLRVPKALGDFLVLRALRDSQGTAIAISDEESLDASIELSRLEGIFPAPEGGACVAAARKLYQNRFLHPEEVVVIFNTGSGSKYTEAFSSRYPRSNSSEQDKLGGLILPR